MKKFFVFALMMVLPAAVTIVGTSGVAHAHSQYVGVVSSACPGASINCGTCHISPGGGGPTTTFGSSFGSNGDSMAGLACPGGAPAPTPTPTPAPGPTPTPAPGSTPTPAPGPTPTPAPGPTPTPAATPTPPPSVCTYTYSAWGPCQSTIHYGGIQTRTLTSSSPAGCTGTPVLSQTCAVSTPAPTPAPAPTTTPPPPPTSITGTVWDSVNKRLGIGVPTPQFTVDTSSMGTMESQMHFSLNGNNVGGWLTSALDNNFFMSSGAYYDYYLGGWVQASPDGYSGMIGTQTTNGLTVFLQQGGAVGSAITVVPRFRILYNGNVGIGATAPTQTLEVNGGIRVNTSTIQPVCDANARGTFWVAQGASGDTVQVCILSGGIYVWRTIAN